MVGPPLALVVDAGVLTSVNGLLVLAVSAAPIVTTKLAAAPSAWLARFVPLLGQLLAELLRRVVAACEAARVTREQLFVLAHGAVTYAVGDMLAQAALPSAAASALAAPAGRVLWDPWLTAWAAVVGLVSDTLPFYHWSSLLQSLRVPLLDRRPALLLPTKIALHLATFQPLSTAGYLFLQGLRKSDGAPGAALAFLRARFAAAILPALATFLVGGPLVYSLPVVAGAALRNLGVLAMCVYLAVVAAR